MVELSILCIDSIQPDNVSLLLNLFSTQIDLIILKTSVEGFHAPFEGERLINSVWLFKIQYFSILFFSKLTHFLLFSKLIVVMI